MAGEPNVELTHQCVLSAICMSSFDYAIVATQEPIMSESPRKIQADGSSRVITSVAHGGCGV